MLNINTRNTLSQLSAINNSMIISHPVTCVIMGKSIQAFLDVSKLKESEFNEIGVYNIGEFNSVVNVIENPEITNNEGILTIKNDSSSIKYGTTSIDIIESECRGNVNLINRIKTNNKVVEFELTDKDLDNIKKMSGLLKDLSDLEITSVDDKITLTVTSTEKSSNNFVLDMNGTTTEDIKMSLIMDVVSKLPADGFNVAIYKSEKGSLVAVFSSIKVEGLDIVISSKAS